MPETRCVPVGGDVSLEVDVWPGDGVPFLLVHGLASNRHLWDGVADELAGAGHRVVTVDLRGHGRSDKPDDGYDFATVAGDLVRVVDALGLERPVVAGQSWGGNVVLELAARHPGRTRGIVCVDGGWLELGELFPTWDEAAERLAPPPLEGLRAEDVERYLRRAHPDWPASGIDGAMACLERLSDGTVRPWLRRDRHMRILAELWGHRPSERWEDVPVPVLLVPCAGGEGAMADATPRQVAVAEQRARRVRTAWFEADHDVHAQHPDAIARLLHAATEDGFFT